MKNKILNIGLKLSAISALALSLSACAVYDPCTHDGAYNNGFSDGQWGNFQHHYASSCPGNRRSLNNTYRRGFRNGSQFNANVDISVYQHHGRPHHHPHYPNHPNHPHHHPRPHPHPHHNPHPLGPGGTQHLIGPGGTQRPAVGPGGTQHLIGPGGTQHLLGSS